MAINILALGLLQMQLGLAIHFAMQSIVKRNPESQIQQLPEHGEIVNMCKTYNCCLALNTSRLGSEDQHPPRLREGSTLPTSMYQGRHLDSLAAVLRFTKLFRAKHIYISCWQASTSMPKLFLALLPCHFMLPQNVRQFNMHSGSRRAGYAPSPPYALQAHRFE